MYENYKKECYDLNPHYKVHYSHGFLGNDSTLNYLHYDKDLMIEFYRKGASAIHVEGMLYNIHEGDIVLLTPDELHVSTIKDDCYIEKISLHINQSLFYQVGMQRAVFWDTIVKKEKGLGNLIPADVVRKFGLDNELNQCLDYARQSSLEAQVLLGCKMIEILAQLSKLVENNDNRILCPTSSNQIVNQIIDYINRHYTEDITLDILAEKFHFSKYYISHLFKDYVGVSPYDYLIIRRLYICNDLIRGKHTIKEACFLVGFHNYANFYRLYKKHLKITPQQFKEQINERK